MLKEVGLEVERKRTPENQELKVKVDQLVITKASQSS